MLMNDEKRMIGNYAVEQSIHIGKKEVVFCVDKRAEHPYVVCYCDYNNPFSAPWPTEAVGTEDYLEAMQIFCERVQTQIEQTRAEQEKFKFDPTPFTVADCIPDMRNKSIVGKVVVINAEPKRYEYQHAAYQLVLAEGGNGATGGRGQAVFGTCLATGEHSRWERYDVLGEIKPERMPQWANNNFSAVVPYDLEQQRKESKEFLDDLTTRDQRMMFAVLTLVHTAETKEQLDSDTEALLTTARKHLCQFAVLKYQQMDGLNTALPFGVRKIDALRTLTTESLAVFIPFRVQEIYHKDGVYYGQNVIIKNMIIANRRHLLNGNSFILGVSGAGKSFTAKEEMTNIILTDPNADVIIIDPEREYSPLVKAMQGEVIHISATSENHINPITLRK